MKAHNKVSNSVKVAIVAIIFIIAIIGFAMFILPKTGQSPKDEAPTILLVEPGVGSGRIAPTLELFSSNAVVFDPESGTVLYGKNADERVYPASLTKIMTAMLLVENMPDLDTAVTMEYADYVGLYESNAAMAGFLTGEVITARDLLYATLLPSGAEAANAIARVVSGSQENFISLMNSRASALGMVNTNFVNVTGLHDENHYTTMKDLALLLCQALKSDDFSTAFGSTRYITTKTTQHSNGILLSHTIVPRLAQLDNRDLAPIVGMKTGYTTEAQLCLASIAKKGDVTRGVISVGAVGSSTSSPDHLIDAYLLYEKSLPK